MCDACQASIQASKDRFRSPEAQKDAVGTIYPCPSQTSISAGKLIFANSNYEHYFQDIRDQNIRIPAHSWTKEIIVRMSVQYQRELSASIYLSYKLSVKSKGQKQNNRLPSQCPTQMQVNSAANYPDDMDKTDDRHHALAEIQDLNPNSTPPIVPL